MASSQVAPSPGQSSPHAQVQIQMRVQYEPGDKPTAMSTPSAPSAPSAPPAPSAPSAQSLVVTSPPPPAAAPENTSATPTTVRIEAVEIPTTALEAPEILAGAESQSPQEPQATMATPQERIAPSPQTTIAQSPQVTIAPPQALHASGSTMAPEAIIAPILISPASTLILSPIPPPPQSPQIPSTTAATATITTVTAITAATTPSTTITTITTAATTTTTTTTSNGLASPPSTIPPRINEMTEMTNNRKRPSSASPSDHGGEEREAKRQRKSDGAGEEMQQRTPESHDGSRTPKASADHDMLEPSTSPTAITSDTGDAAAATATMLAEKEAQKQQEEAKQAEEEEWQRQRPKFANLYPKMDEPARTGLQQCIALVLKHVGFDGASPEAMEEFTHLVENYIADFSASIQQAALSARRTIPAPIDFQFALPEHNLAPWQLKKHLKPPRRLPEVPVPASILEKHFPRTAQADLPVFDLLSGDEDRQCKVFIPSHFPAFPSIHTYRYTAMDAKFAAAVIKGEEVDEAKVAAEARKKKQEQTVMEAKQSEETLRGFLKATKKRTLKEMSTKALGGRDTGARNRYLALENAMSAFGGARG